MSFRPLYLLTKYWQSYSLHCKQFWWKFKKGRERERDMYFKFHPQFFMYHETERERRTVLDIKTSLNILRLVLLRFTQSSCISWFLHYIKLNELLYVVGSCYFYYSNLALLISLCCRMLLCCSSSCSSVLAIFISIEPSVHHLLKSHRVDTVIRCWFGS